jgi:hypothetical protein
MQIELPMFEDRPQVYRALCELWASEAFQERSRKHRNPGTASSTHTLGGDGYRRKAQRHVRNRFMLFRSNIQNCMILTSTYRQLMERYSVT